MGDLAREVAHAALVWWIFASDDSNFESMRRVVYSIDMITLSDLHQAQARIKGVAIRTPLILCSGYDEKHKLYFKPENFQPVGAFKIRGAYNAIKSLTPEEPNAESSHTPAATTRRRWLTPPRSSARARSS